MHLKLILNHTIISIFREWYFITMDYYMASKWANGFSGFLKNSELQFDSRHYKSTTLVIKRKTYGTNKKTLSLPPPK